MADTELRADTSQNLLITLNEPLGGDKVNATGWGCLWLADIERLECLVKIAKDKLYVAAVNQQSELVPRWTQRAKERQMSESEGVPIFTAAAGLYKQRDQQRCLITGKSGVVDVARVYPYSMQEARLPKRTTSFWNALRVFWTKEKVDSWHNALSSTGTEVAQNLLTLTPDAYRYFERGYCALKPISVSADNLSLSVRFYWLHGSTATESRDCTPPLLEGGLEEGTIGTSLFKPSTQQPIRSGDIITIHTNDPVAMPLPDIRILEIQWYLQRITAITGAAEDDDSLEGYDLEDDLEEDETMEGFDSFIRASFMRAKYLNSVDSS